MEPGVNFSHGRCEETLKKSRNPAWMSQEVSNWLVSGLFHLLINGVFLGVKQPTDPNH